MSLLYALFVKYGGWPNGWRWASDGGVAGTTYQTAMTDAFRIQGFGFPVEFRIHVEQDAWHRWFPADGNSFDSGIGKRLEAIGFRFPQGIPPGTTILARAHVEGLDWMPIINFKDLIDPDTDYLGTTDKSLRLEAIQIVKGSGPDANEDHLRKIINDKWDAINVIVRPIGEGDRETAYHIPSGKSVIVQSAQLQIKTITIVCGEPNAVSYRTEGNSPATGANDSGRIEPGQRSTFKIAGLDAEVFVEARYGDANVTVLID
jgi:hypothetical protein